MNASSLKTALWRRMAAWVVAGVLAVVPAIAGAGTLRLLDSFVLDAGFSRLVGSSPAAVDDLSADRAGGEDPAVEAESGVEAPVAVERAEGEPVEREVSRPERRPASADPVLFGKVEVGVGEKAGPMVLLFADAVIDGEADEVVVIGGTVRIGENGRVAELVAVASEAEVDGRVDSDVVSVATPIRVGPTADIRGDLVVIGGPLERSPEADIEGERVAVEFGRLPGASEFYDWVRSALFLGRPFAPGLPWMWALALVVLALQAAAFGIARPAAEACVRTLEERPGASLLAGLLFLLLAGPVGILLSVLVIGGPLWLLVCLVVAFLGRPVLHTAVARRLGLGGGGGLFTALLVGTLVFLILYSVPLLGGLIWFAGGIFGVGAVVLAALAAMGSGGAGARPAAVGGSPAGVAAAPRGGPGPVASGVVSPGPVRAPAETPGITASPVVPPTRADLVDAPAGPAVRATVDPAAAAFAAELGGAIPSEAPSSSVGPGGEVPPVLPVVGVPPIPPPAEALRVPGTLPRATLGPRLGAAMIDVVVVGVASALLTSGDAPLFWALMALYCIGFWTWKGTTIGGVLLQLRLEREDGTPVTWAVSAVRFLGCFLSLLPLGLGFIWPAFHPGRQAWHDMIAGTVVVRVPKSTPLL